MRNDAGEGGGDDGQQGPAAVSLARPWLLVQQAAANILVDGGVAEHIKTQPTYPAHHRGLRALEGEVYPSSVTCPILEGYAELRLAMRKPYGTGLIGDIAALIAATPLEDGLTVVTTDRDFTRVPRLPLTLVDQA